MPKPLIHERIAILVANGFSEQDMSCVQKKFQKAGAFTRIIAMDHGLVNSWSGSDWGYHYAADNVLSSSLAVDYSMLFVPGGRRSIEKLRLTAHTKRFINGFIGAGKPAAFVGDAAGLFITSGLADGKEVSCPEYLKPEAEAHGVNVSRRPSVSDGNILTARGSEDPEQMAKAVVEHFSRYVASPAIYEAA